MAKILFKLRNVPDDEADEVRALLTEHEIDFYETSAGNWGISMPAIWLHDDRKLHHARALIDQYQAARVVKARQDYAQLQRQGKTETFFDRLRHKPIRMVLYLAIIVFILYVSTMPFIDILQR